jgi:hypothetical protein
MPVWASILVTVIAAAASGGFGAWLGTWNDRHERFRDRMIVAADGFVGGGSEALIALRDAIFLAQRGMGPSTDEAIARAWKERDVVIRRRARVELLFGPDSETARAADGLRCDLGSATDKLQGQAPDVAAADRELSEAKGKLREFQGAAFEGILRAAPPSATIRASLRRMLPHSSGRGLASRSR